MQNDFYDSILIPASHPAKAKSSAEPHMADQITDDNRDFVALAAHQRPDSDAPYRRAIGEGIRVHLSFKSYSVQCCDWLLTAHYYTSHYCTSAGTPVIISCWVGKSDTVIIKCRVQREGGQKRCDRKKLSSHCFTFNAAFIYSWTACGR